MPSVVPWIWFTKSILNYCPIADVVASGFGVAQVGFLLWSCWFSRLRFVSAVVWESDPVSLLPAAEASYAHGFFICGCLGINVLFLPPQIETIDQHFFSPLLISSCFSLCSRPHKAVRFFKSLIFFNSNALHLFWSVLVGSASDKSEDHFINSSVASTLSCLVFL